VEHLNTNDSFVLKNNLNSSDYLIWELNRIN
jgi:hypothetical protein